MSYLSCARVSMFVALIMMAMQGFVPNYPAQAMLWLSVMFYEWHSR